MKKNQERRLHRKNAKIVKEGGTPLTLSRSTKPDTTVSNCTCHTPISTSPGQAHPFCPLNSHAPRFSTEALRELRTNGPHECVAISSSLAFPRNTINRSACFFVTETNRKCPRWAEFNTGDGAASASAAGAGAPTPSATSPPPSTPGGGLFPSATSALRVPNTFAPGAPSPLATSPPVYGLGIEVGMGADEEEEDAEGEDDDEGAGMQGGAPKLKLTLGKRG